MRQSVSYMYRSCLGSSKPMKAEIKPFVVESRFQGTPRLALIQLSRNSCNSSTLLASTMPLLNTYNSSKYLYESKHVLIVLAVLQLFQLSTTLSRPRPPVWLLRNCNAAYFKSFIGDFQFLSQVYFNGKSLPSPVWLLKNCNVVDFKSSNREFQFSDPLSLLKAIESNFPLLRNDNTIYSRSESSDVIMPYDVVCYSWRNWSRKCWMYVQPEKVAFRLLLNPGKVFPEMPYPHVLLLSN